MDMKRISILAILMAFAIAFFGVMNVNALGSTAVGVKVGDWAEYSMDLNAGTSTLHETLKVQVTNIVSTTIYYSVTWNPLISSGNNSQLNLMFSNSGSFDVNTQVSTGSYVGYFFGANSTGFAIGGANFAMTRTIQKDYCGQTFEINYLTAEGTGISESIYWVKSTGVLMEIEISANGFEMTMKITGGTYIPSINQNPCDVNGDGKVNILDISIVAKAFGSKTGEAWYNPKADIDSNGVIDIRDMSKVAKAFKF